MKTTFLRVLDADDKAGALLVAIHDSEQARGVQRFEVDTTSFGSVPRSPFAYWVSERQRDIFLRHRSLQQQYLAVRGAYTTDDFRYYRLSWENHPRMVARTREGTLSGLSLVPLAKGGAFSPFYSDVYLLIRWANDGAEPKVFLSSYRERKGWGADWSACLNGHDHYFRPGLTWPRRTQGGLSIRVMPAGCIFADKGPAAFVENDDCVMLLAMLAIVNSRAFRSLVDQQMAFGSYEVGVIQRTPVPAVHPQDRALIASLAGHAWSKKRSLDTCTETSHAFTLPALLQVQGANLNERAAAWSTHILAVESDLANIQAEIDDRCFTLYSINDEDRRAITEGFGAAPDVDAEADTEAEDDSDNSELRAPNSELLSAALLAYAAGVAFGRFDLRLATGARPLPPDPEPFDPLPPCSPGMLTGDDGLPLHRPPPDYPIAFPDSGILVDDQGHAQDLATAVRAVFDVIFGADADQWWNDVAAVLDPKRRDLRAWLATSFFEHHLKRYSKSRRKAPILWQLATPSARYSVWLYAHRVTADTFYLLQNEVVGPKALHEERRLASLIQSAGASPTPGQRREIADQESLVEELRAFLEEIKRIAPAWHPDLDDGVVLVMAPLHRLVPQHRAWQKELATRWDELTAGKYDWAHLALHLWPERVVPKCADDRSLAIAHGLEEAFWVRSSEFGVPNPEHRTSNSERWVKREVDPATVAAIIADRSRAAVKDAVHSLIEAPAAAGVRHQASGVRRAAVKKARTAKPEKLELDFGASPPSQPPNSELRTPNSELSELPDRVREAIAAASDGASKSDVQAATGITDGQWTAVIGLLLAQGIVIKTGERRGARYHLAGAQHA